MGLDSVAVNTQQPAPNRRPAKPIWKSVIEDMSYRNSAGIKKYGVPLVSNNGRNAVIDAYQETLDLAAYLRQTIDEREKAIKHINAAADSIAEAVLSLEGKDLLEKVLTELTTIRSLSQFK